LQSVATINDRELTSFFPPHSMLTGHGRRK
jgi:hypothetical protein